MGSKPSKARRQPTPVATETPAVPVVPKTPQDPRIPNEIIDKILNHLIADSGSWGYSPQRSLRSCSLVSKSWVPPCRRYLFHTIIFTSKDVTRWLETFPVPEESPAYYVKDLRLSLGGHYGAHNEFFEHIPWFTNVEKVAVTMGVTLASFGASLFTRLPQSVTSLAIRGTAWDEVDLVQMRDIMTHLPNLNDLILSGTVVARSQFRKLLPGLGAILRGRFGGELRIRDRHNNRHFVTMLLEVPTGLHFTKIHIHADCVRHLRTVGLAEACYKTLVHLSYLCVMRLDGWESFERSFDFSESPRLQKVTFSLDFVHGSLHYIPMALSTLKPSTSPHLSFVHLRFTHLNPPSETWNPENMGNDLQQIADELSRIEREYEGAVALSVFRDMEFGRLDTLNVLQHWDH